MQMARQLRRAEESREMYRDVEKEGREASEGSESHKFAFTAS